MAMKSPTERRDFFYLKISNAQLTIPKISIAYTNIEHCLLIIQHFAVSHLNLSACKDYGQKFIIAYLPFDVQCEDHGRNL